MELLRNAWASLEHRFGRRATVALIVALTAPLLIAVTGLAIDIGFWYEQHTSLQSSADGAAMSAATAAAVYGENTNGTAQPYALVTANVASNSQFALPSSAVTVSAGTSTTNATTQITTTPWTATVQIPRSLFFSGVSGMGLGGLGAGTQSASATADVVSLPPSCVLSTNPTAANAITVAAGSITAYHCSITANSSASGNSGCAVTANSDASITASDVNSVGCTLASNSKITATINQGVRPAADPLATMNPTNWVPASPTVPAGLPAYACSGGLNGCSAPYGKSVTGLTGDYLKSATLNYQSTSASNETVTNSVSLTLLSGSKLTVSLGNLYVNGSFSISSSGAMTQAGNLMVVTGPASFGSGSGPYTFAGGTYFFEGGLTISKATVSFGPGIYYISGGNLDITASAQVTATNATFVLENGAGFEDNGGGSFSITAPTTGCVTPASYPETSYENAAPYDGTNGEGICNVAIYQARTDTTADNISPSAGSTMNGVFYFPEASLTVGGTFKGTSTSNVLAFIANTFNDTAGGSITFSAGAGNPLNLTGPSTIFLVK